ncbi:hypothetical protein SK128_022702, partial [Halocaridina rubra]
AMGILCCKSKPAQAQPSLSRLSSTSSSYRKKRPDKTDTTGPIQKQPFEFPAEVTEKPRISSKTKETAKPVVATAIPTTPPPDYDQVQESPLKHEADIRPETIKKVEEDTSSSSSEDEDPIKIQTSKQEGEIQLPERKEDPILVSPVPVEQPHAEVSQEIEKIQDEPKNEVQTPEKPVEEVEVPASQIEPHQETAKEIENKDLRSDSSGSSQAEAETKDVDPSPSQPPPGQPESVHVSPSPTELKGNDTETSTSQPPLSEIVTSVVGTVVDADDRISSDEDSDTPPPLPTSSPPVSDDDEEEEKALERKQSISAR